MRDNWERGGGEGAALWADRKREREREREKKEGGSSMETHKPSSLAGAGYNDTQ